MFINFRTLFSDSFWGSVWYVFVVSWVIVDGSLLVPKVALGLISDAQNNCNDLKELLDWGGVIITLGLVVFSVL